MSAKFNFNDLVRVSGYCPKIFRVESYSRTTYHEPNETWTETVYNLICTTTAEFIEADADDLTLVTESTDNSKYIGGEMDMAEQERQPTARELSAKEAEERKAARKAKAEEIDNLLDRRNFYADQFAQNGDVEDNERVQRIDAELKALAETD